MPLYTIVLGCCNPISYYLVEPGLVVYNGYSHARRYRGFRLMGSLRHQLKSQQPMRGAVACAAGEPGTRPLDSGSNQDDRTADHLRTNEAISSLVDLLARQAAAEWHFTPFT